MTKGKRLHLVLLKQVNEMCLQNQRQQFVLNMHATHMHLGSNEVLSPMSIVERLLNE